MVVESRKKNTGGWVINRKREETESINYRIEMVEGGRDTVVKVRSVRREKF